MMKNNPNQFFASKEYEFGGIWQDEVQLIKVDVKQLTVSKYQSTGSGRESGTMLIKKLSGKNLKALQERSIKIQNFKKRFTNDMRLTDYHTSSIK